MKIIFREYRLAPTPMPTDPDKKTFENDDNFQIVYYAKNSGGGGGGGDATAANQVLQIAQETTIATQVTAINTKVSTAANQVLQLAQETIVADNIKGFPGSGGNVTLAVGVPQIVSYSGSFGYTNINVQLNAALASGRTILVEVSSVSPYVWRTVTTLNNLSELHTEFADSPYFFVRFTLTGAGASVPLSYLMTNFSGLGATAANQTALLADIKDETPEADSVFKNPDGFSVFKTRNDTDPTQSVFTNGTNEVSHFEKSASNKSSVFRKDASGMGHISAFVNEAGDKSIFDSSQINEKLVVASAFTGYSDVGYNFAAAVSAMESYLNVTPAIVGQQIIKAEVLYNPTTSDWGFYVLTKTV